MKKSLLTLNLLFYFFIVNGQIPIDSLIASYSFNGDANDEIQSYNGVVYGATLTEDRFSRENSAFSFDGNDYIEIPSSEKLLDGDYTFSISAWVLFHTKKTQNIVGKGSDLNGNFSSYQDWSIKMNSTLNAHINNTSGNGANVIAKQNISTHKWYHVVMSVDSDTMRTYIDGELTNKEKICCNGFEISERFPLTIGGTRSLSDLGLSSRFFEGKIDDIRIFKSTLTHQDVMFLFYESPSVCEVNSHYEESKECDTLFIPITITYSDNNSETETIIKIYPNPADSYVNIEFSDEEAFEGYSYKIVDQEGRLVIEKDILAELDILNFSDFDGPGAYVISFYKANGDVLSSRTLILE